LNRKFRTQTNAAALLILIATPLNSSFAGATVSVANPPIASATGNSDPDLLMLEEALLPIKVIRMLIQDGCSTRLAAKFAHDYQTLEAAIPGITAAMVAAAGKQCSADLDRFTSDDHAAIASYLTRTMTAPDRHRLAILFRKAVQETESVNIDAAPVSDPNRAKKAVEAVKPDLAGFAEAQRKFVQTPGGAHLIDLMSHYQSAHNQLLEQVGERIVRRGLSAAFIEANDFARQHGFDPPFKVPEETPLPATLAGK
jgi:hypothetical protein